MVFPTFFNLSLNLAIRSSWFEPQSAPGLVFADCIELLHLCPRHAQGGLTSLAPHERLPEILVVPRTKFRLKLKKVGKTIRPFRYDLNQIPYDYTVEVRNRFKAPGVGDGQGSLAGCSRWGCKELDAGSLQSWDRRVRPRLV